MGIQYMLRQPDGELEYGYSMSYGGFSSIINVGEKAGIDMSDYRRILSYTDYVETEMVIEEEDIRTLLCFFRNMLARLQELEEKGIVLLSQNEEINFRQAVEAGRSIPSSREKFAGTIPTLRTLIELCEKALASGSPIIAFP